MTSDGEDRTTPRLGLDTAGGEDRTVEVAVVPRHEYDRLRAIEEAARVVCDPMVQDGGGDRWWSAIDALRAALEGAPDDQ